MEILTGFLYLLLIIVFLIALTCLSLLFIPMQYKLDGGYDYLLHMNFNISFAPLLTLRGNWDNSTQRSFQVKFVIFGLPFSLHPEKWSKKEKETKKERQQKKNNLPVTAFLRCLDRDIINNFIMMLGDLLHILRPKKVEVRGKLGFAEPHLNGWLAALNAMLEACHRSIKVDLEQVWEEEHYDLTFSAAGRLVVCIMLLRVLRFILTRRTLQFLRKLRKEKKYYSAFQKQATF